MSTLFVTQVFATCLVGFVTFIRTANSKVASEFDVAMFYATLISTFHIIASILA